MKNNPNKMLNGLLNNKNTTELPTSSKELRKLLKTVSVDLSYKRPSNPKPSSKSPNTSNLTPRPSRETHGTTSSNSSPKSPPLPPSKPILDPSPKSST